MAQVLPMLTRARAFYSCGVLLSLPAHSRSGVRNDDGGGCLCPLWRPAGRAPRVVEAGAEYWAKWAASERLR
jgi:hypothetical protein